MDPALREKEMDPRPGVQALVAPLSAATFCEEYWPLRYFGSHGPPERLAGLCDLAELRDIESLLQVHRGRTRVVFTNSGGRYRETEVSPQQALRLYEAGMTVCLSEVELASASIAAWLLALARDLALPARAVQCNAYASPQDKGFAKHCDDHEVFVVQIRGEKLWSIATNNDVLYPTQNYIPGIGRPEEIRLYCPQDAPSEMPSDAHVEERKHRFRISSQGLKESSPSRPRSPSLTRTAARSVTAAWISRS